jgi:hypothetical protein
MGRMRLVIVLGVLAALALVLRRRRARPAAPPPLPPPASPGPPEDTRESLRRFVEAGERLREGEQASPEL